MEKEVQRIVPLELKKTISEAVTNNNGTILEQVDQKLEVRITPLLNNVSLLNTNIMKEFAMLKNRQNDTQDSTSQQNPNQAKHNPVSPNAPTSNSAKGRQEDGTEKGGSPRRKKKKGQDQQELNEEQDVPPSEDANMNSESFSDDYEWDEDEY